MDGELETIARLRHGKEVERIIEESEKERKQRVVDLTRRGLARSGPMENALLDIHIKTAQASCKAFSDIWTDILTRKHGKLTLEHVEYICERVQQITSGFRKYQPKEPTLHLGPYIQQQLEMKLAGIAGQIRRDLEIMRREQDSLPSRRDNQKSEVTNIYHLHGHNSRVNIDSTDQSVNSVALPDAEIFFRLKSLISSEIKDQSQLQVILERLASLEAEVGKPGFAQKYSDFISAAADYMTLLCPFVPALTELMQRSLGR